MTEMKKAGVIGWPIKHSRSPLIHQYWLDKYNIEGSYEKFAVEEHELENFIKTMRENGLIGINVTIPHKEQVFHFADEITKEAEAIGAANTLWFEGEKLIAGNTDAYGFLAHLQQSAPDWQSNQPALILGAGGAARALIYALQQSGVPKITLANRTLARAEKLAEEFGSPVTAIHWEDRHKALSECGLLVNSTSLGMQGHAPLEISLEALPSTAIVYDIVYTPLETGLLKVAKEKGITAVDGLGMLLHQAVKGFEKWFGKRPEVTDELRSILINDLDAKT